MDEMEFDKTRKAIGVEKLAGEDRKAMMEKLTSAGGQVLSEKSVKEQVSAGSDSGKGVAKAGGGGAGDFRMPSEIAREKRRLEMEKQAQMRSQMESEIKAITGFTARFMIKLKGKLAGVTHFSSDSVTTRFMSQLNLDAKRAVMECSILANDLFMSNPAIGREIVKDLDARGPIYVEVIERTAKLYDRSELSSLTSAYNAAPDVPVPISMIRDAVFSLLRKLYYLKPYQETYLVAVDIAIEKQKSLEKKQATLYSAKKKKIRSDWNTLMDVIYPGLVLIAQRAEMKKAEPGSFLFEDMIQASNLDKLGQRKSGSPVGEDVPKAAAEQPKPEDAAAKKTGSEGGNESPDQTQEETEKNSAVSRGYDIMRSLNMQQLRSKYDPKNEYAKMPDKDKVLISYLYFKEFDSEYSFLLTTPKLQLNTTYKNGEKIDLKRNLSLLLEAAHPVTDAFRIYVKEFNEYHSMVSAADAGKNYVEHAKRVAHLEKKRANAGRDARNQIKEFMNKVGRTIKMLVDDMKIQGNLVSNPDEIIKFENQLEAKKIMNGKSIRDALNDAYSFTTVFASRLENGDLFGGVIDLSDEEYAKAFPVQQTSASEGTPAR